MFQQTKLLIFKNLLNYLKPKKKKNLKYKIINNFYSVLSGKLKIYSIINPAFLPLITLINSYSTSKNIKYLLTPLFFFK